MSFMGYMHQYGFSFGVLKDSDQSHIKNLFISEGFFCKCQEFLEDFHVNMNYGDVENVYTIIFLI
jgi:hypothetical protein